MRNVQRFQVILRRPADDRLLLITLATYKYTGTAVRPIPSLAIENRYIHCDAALCGGYAAFLDPPPAWNFEDGADSIAISGHKFLGSPIPCGIVLARRAHVDRIGHSVAYIGSVDTTISGYHYDIGTGKFTTEFTKKSQTIHIRHIDVTDEQANPFLAKTIKRLITVSSTFDLKPFLG